jgi:dTDP-glucose 4,6-dehydratase
MLCETLDNCFARSPALRQQFPRAPLGRADSLIQFVKDRPGHDRRYAISSEKVERQLGFKPSVSLSDGLNKTVEWYLANEDWWRALQRSRSKAWDWG